jgi:hypothetical protein
MVIAGRLKFQGLEVSMDPLGRTSLLTKTNTESI